ncbi:MAG: YicC/YloC family endoribonuclease [Saccharofermentanales bacterium]|jgi:uncharacterized protein (TIGR00255 family)|nr:YicC family protein [Clostridiaceae bacterium]
MPISMTGYGRGEASDDSRYVVVEIKTVNSRYCDQQIRLPRVLAALENRVRELIGQHVARGKIDVFINYADAGDAAYQVTVDAGLAKSYASALREMARVAEIPADFNVAALSRFPDILRVEATRPDPESTWTVLHSALTMALDALIRMRTLEGERLARDIRQRVEELVVLLEGIALRAPSVVCEYRARLTARVEELLGEQATEIFDQQRIAAEVAIFADKCGIDEEIVRLKSHLRQVDNLLMRSGPMGKELDFLVQEINREINTIGSKANDLELIKQVVAMKSQLEKIREQVQNLE